LLKLYFQFFRRKIIESKEETIFLKEGVSKETLLEECKKIEAKNRKNFNEIKIISF
jgi:hypothetical protein